MRKVYEIDNYFSSKKSSVGTAEICTDLVKQFQTLLREVQLAYTT